MTRYFLFKNKVLIGLLKSYWYIKRYNIVKDESSSDDQRRKKKKKKEKKKKKKSSD